MRGVQQHVTATSFVLIGCTVLELQFVWCERSHWPTRVQNSSSVQFMWCEQGLVCRWQSHIVTISGHAALSLVRTVICRQVNRTTPLPMPPAHWPPLSASSRTLRQSTVNSSNGSYSHCSYHHFNRQTTNLFRVLMTDTGQSSLQKRVPLLVPLQRSRLRRSLRYIPHPPLTSSSRRCYVTAAMTSLLLRRHFQPHASLCALYTVRQKKGTNFLLCASLLILDRNW